MKIHLETKVNSHDAACGLTFCGLKIFYLWHDKRKVTCGNCRRTK
jgi:hypothetical protein